jgi:hypothetical protein
MAKKLYKAPKHFTGHIVTTKTHFGTTSDMVVDHSLLVVDGNPVVIAENSVLCKDDSGYYVTLKTMVNSGLADPNRHSNPNNRINATEPEKETSSS